jgi:threonine/homoserine/homoserine lactone efflux protein
MPPLETSISFFGFSVLLALSPGPDNLFVLMHAALHGRRSGMLVVLGLCTGLLVHTAAVASGLAAVFAASQIAFDTVRLAGAAYLAFLAWQAFRAPVSAGPEPPAAPARRMYVRGIVMNLANPKVAIFFLAFLPQFVQAERGGVGQQVMWLGIVFILATLVTFGAIAHYAASLRAVLGNSPALRRGLNRLAGLVFLGLALRLAVSQR